VQYLEHIVQPGFVVFEFGSGASTPWFAERTAYIYSVESDPDWHAAVWEALKPIGCYELTLCPVEDKYGSQHYADQIKQQPDESVDLVFIDGKARPHCLLAAKPKVKPGGWMVMDDLTYNPVKTALHLLDDWQFAASFKGRVLGAIDGHPRTNTTGFWRKP